MLEFPSTETRDQWLSIITSVTKSFLEQRKRRGKVLILFLLLQIFPQCLSLQTVETLHAADPALALVSPRVRKQKGIDDTEEPGGTLRREEVNQIEKMKRNKRKALENLLAEEDLYVGDLAVILDVSRLLAKFMWQFLIYEFPGLQGAAGRRAHCWRRVYRFHLF
jgi:hypothetical protein